MRVAFVQERVTGLRAGTGGFWELDGLAMVVTEKNRLRSKEEICKFG